MTGFCCTSYMIVFIILGYFSIHIVTIKLVIFFWGGVCLASSWSVIRTSLSVHLSCSVFLLVVAICTVLVLYLYHGTEHTVCHNTVILISNRWACGIVPQRMVEPKSKLNQQHGVSMHNNPVPDTRHHYEKPNNTFRNVSHTYH